MSGLVDPFGLLRDAAYGAERLGRSLIGQDRIRLAVTGLTRAGNSGPRIDVLFEGLGPDVALDLGSRVQPMVERAVEFLRQEMDAGTVRRHLDTLTERAPDSVAAYVALARRTTERALATGRLKRHEGAPLVALLDGHGPGPLASVRAEG